MQRTGATRNDVHIDHHLLQSPIAVEWVIGIELDDRLLFLVYQPVIAAEFGVMLVGVAIATSPLFEDAAVVLVPRENVSQRHLDCFRPGAYSVDHLISNIMGNPALI